MLLATGIGVVAVSSALAGLAQQYWQLLVLRGAGGVGSIMFSVSAASLLIRVTPSHQRGRAQGVWAGSFLIGLIAGPAVGTVASFSLRLPFFLYAGTLAGRGRARAWRAAAQRARRAADTRAVAPLALRTALRNRAYIAALVAVLRRRLRRSSGRAARSCRSSSPTISASAPGWVYAAFLVVSLVSGALLLPFGTSPTRADGGR